MLCLVRSSPLVNFFGAIPWVSAKEHLNTQGILTKTYIRKLEVYSFVFVLGRFPAKLGPETL